MANMLFFLSGISVLRKASTIGGERESYLDPGENSDSHSLLQLTRIKWQKPPIEHSQHQRCCL